MKTDRSDPLFGLDEGNRPAIYPNGPQRFEIVKRGRHYVIPPTGHVVPSVTNILGAIAKPALIHWAANEERELVMNAAADIHHELAGGLLTRDIYLSVLRDRLGHAKAHQKKLRKAADIGSEAHAHIEWVLKKELGIKVPKEAPKISDQAQWAVMAWEDWRKGKNLKIIEVEKTVWSKEILAAGTADLFAVLDLELDEGRIESCAAALEWKSGKAIYGEALLQTATYAQMLVEMGESEDDDTWGIVVRLPKVDTDPEFEVALISPKIRRTLFDVFHCTKVIWEWMNAE